MDQPIGIFDSGIGGTSIASEINYLLPNESIIYLADSKNAPYGIKPKKIINQLAHKNTEKLLDLGAKLIVVACNTATTNSIEELRNTYRVPFVGIEPAIKPASLQTLNNRIGILATKGTLASELFAKTSKRFISKEIELTQVEGVGIVEAIESNLHTSKEFITNLNNQLLPFKENKIDSLVLGCTHYPFIKDQIQNFLPGVKIIDSGFAVAKQTKKLLNKYKIVNSKNDTCASINIFSNNKNLSPIEMITKNLFRTNPKVKYLDY